MGWELLTSQSGVLAYCGLLTLFAIFGAARLYSACKCIIKTLESANDELASMDGESGFTDKYEDFNKRIKSDKLLGHAWSEFTETLIFPSENDNEKVIKNSHEASEFFNEESILFQPLHIRFYNAFPNYLTGGGILGTFIGLAVGISLAGPKLTSHDHGTDIVIQGLSDLLGGASLAFITSICGLVLSILFSIFEKNRLKKVRGLLMTWNRLLNERLKRITTESIANEQLAEAKKQTALLDRFNTDLAVNIASALDEKMAQNLGPSMASLIEAVNRLRDDRGETNQKLLTNLLEEFKESLSGSVGSEMSGLGDTLGELNKTLNVTLKSLADEQVTMKETTKELTDDLTTAIKQNNQNMNEDMNRLMGDILSGLKEASKNMAASMVSAGKQTSDNMTGIIEVFAQSVKKLVDTTSQTDRFLSGIGEVLLKTEQFCNTLQGTHQSLQEVVEPLRLSADNINASSQQTLESMQAIKNIADKLSQHHESIERTHQYLTKTWENYCARFENVDSSLQNVFENIQNSLSAYTAQIQNFVKELDGHSAESLKALSGVIAELQETAESIADSGSGFRK